jgi:hypothetical protein
MIVSLWDMMRAEDETRPRPIVYEASVFSDVGEVRFPMRWLQRFFHKTKRVHKPYSNKFSLGLFFYLLAEPGCLLWLFLMFAFE